MPQGIEAENDSPSVDPGSLAPRDPIPLADEALEWNQLGAPDADLVAVLSDSESRSKKALSSAGISGVAAMTFSRPCSASPSKGV